MAREALKWQSWGTSECQVVVQLRDRVRNHVERQACGNRVTFQIWNRVWYALGGALRQQHYLINEQIELQAKEDTDR
jgi:hypothetical protein